MLKAHKVICLILGILFLIIGLIGLALPVIPQIPFFLVSAFFLAHGSRRIRSRIFGSKLYRDHIHDRLKDHKILQKILEGEQ